MLEEVVREVLLGLFMVVLLSIIHSDALFDLVSRLVDGRHGSIESSCLVF